MSYNVGFLDDSVLNFSTEIDISIKQLKNWFFFTFFDRQSCSMLPWERKFDGKFLFIVLNEKILWVVHHFAHSHSGNLSLKPPVLVGLITKW